MDALHTARALGSRTLAELEDLAAHWRREALDLMAAAGIADGEHWLDRPAPPRRHALPKRLRDQIGERDEWICCICRNPVDKDHAWQHTGDYGRNNAHPSVEHIRPVCVGGGDEPENLAIAHFGCNARAAVWIGDERYASPTHRLIRAVNNARAAATVVAAARAIVRPILDNQV